MGETPDSETRRDLEHLRRAVELVLEAERAGNVPVGAVVTLGGETIAEAGNALLVPSYDPRQVQLAIKLGF